MMPRLDAISDVLELDGARLKKLVIKNLRCISGSPVEIELDDIVVLVGPNNAGKSTILRAFELVMDHGSKAGHLTLEDFPGEKIDHERPPEVELQMYLGSNRPADVWIHKDKETGEDYVRERWVWSAPGPAIRQGFNAEESKWDNKVPWGAGNVAKSYRPKPHRVDAFASPEEQAKSIVELFKAILDSRIEKAFAAEDSPLAKLRLELAKIQREIVTESSAEISRIEERLASIVGSIFKGYKVQLDPRDDKIDSKALSPFASQPILRMGRDDGHLSPIEKQGSGARRTLLWAALKTIAEEGTSNAAKSRAKKSKSPEDPGAGASPSRRNVLLLDEPEICLHPDAVREACKVLYALPEGDSGWQVMITTHSPVFVDLSRDNTTVVRVERNNAGEIQGTTVFRPQRAKLDPDERQLLKLLNLCDPHVSEFFFGGRTIIVEGDTEYSAFKKIVDDYPEEFSGIHIVRARGKATIVALMKILNQFESSYAVLHDSDRPKTKGGRSNPMWTVNRSIAEMAKSATGEVRLVASLPNFEKAFFGEDVDSDKPYNAIVKMSSSDDIYRTVVDLLRSLFECEQKVPAGAMRWKAIEDLEEAISETEVYI